MLFLNSSTQSLGFDFIPESTAVVRALEYATCEPWRWGVEVGDRGSGDSHPSHTAWQWLRCGCFRKFKVGRGTDTTQRSMTP